jgi:hypothetical protein
MVPSKSRIQWIGGLEDMVRGEDGVCWRDGVWIFESPSDGGVWRRQEDGLWNLESLFEG